MTSPVLSFAGLGIGPFNLSIAALLNEAPDINAAFFDAKPEFNWHPGMMLPGARLQTSYLKDLVTAVAPTSPFSFLNYLVSHQRFYQFLCAELPAISRREYADYLGWVARKLDNTYFDSRVEAVELLEDSFQIHLANRDEPVRSRALCLGTGLYPRLPEFAKPYLGSSCFHNADIAQRSMDLLDKRVVVVGGGQSGAEVVESILAEHWGAPASLGWISRRPNFEPLDEVAFSNEYFTPQYVDTFYGLDSSRKPRIVAQQKLASDGISPQTLRSLYRTLYEKRALGDLSYPVEFMPSRELLAMNRDAAYLLGARNHIDGSMEHYLADVVIFCTGFESRVPSYLDPIADRLHDGGAQPYALDRNFQVQWDGPEQLRLFAVNAGRQSHGIAEPQMSLMCWRSATIINAVAKREVFNLRQSMDMVSWTAPTAEEAEPQSCPENICHLPREHQAKGSGCAAKRAAFY